MPLYGQEKWDGIYIITQIVTLQCWYYFLWTLVHCIIGFISGIKYIPIMHVLFNPQTFNDASSLKYVLAIELLIVCTLMSIVVSVVVERSKKCWDYCSTIFILHLFITTATHYFPYSLSWWLLNLCYMAYLIYLSERICLKREMEEIPVDGL